MAKGCESEGCVPREGCVQRVASPRVVFLRGCVSKGHVSEGFDVICKIACPKLWDPGPPLRVCELCVWSVSRSVRLSGNASLLHILRALVQNPTPLCCCCALVCYCPAPACGVTLHVCM